MIAIATHLPLLSYHHLLSSMDADCSIIYQCQYPIKSWVPWLRCKATAKPQQNRLVFPLVIGPNHQDVNKQWQTWEANGYHIIVNIILHHVSSYYIILYHTFDHLSLSSKMELSPRSPWGPCRPPGPTRGSSRGDQVPQRCLTWV